MSGSYRFKREHALPRALALVGQMRPACEKIEIAGSLRRSKESVGDIEIVALPTFEEHTIAGQLDLFGGGTPATVERVSRLDKVLDELVVAGELYRDRPHTKDKGKWGEKMKTVWTKIQTAVGTTFIQVDLFIVTPPAQFGSIFTIRTGPSDFSGADGLMAYINRRTKYQQSDGRLIVRATGEAVDTPTEEAFFRVLGLPWIAPEERSAAKLWQVVTEKGPSTGNRFQ